MPTDHIANAERRLRKNSAGLFLLGVTVLGVNHVWFLNRDDGKAVGQLGSMGETGGQFFGLHMIAVDSKGTIYTGEVFAGERVQRFVPADSPRGKLLEQLSRLQ